MCVCVCEIIIKIISYLQQPRKPLFVGPAVQSGATVLPKEGKCKSSCYTTYIIHLYLDSLQSPCVDCWLIFKVNLLSTPCSSSQGGAMAGEVACLSSMTQGKVNTGCIHEINDHGTVHINWGSSVSVHDVHCVLSEGFAVQRREPAGQRDALWGAQSQECTEDHAESCVPLSRYALQNAAMLHCCEEKGSWCDGTCFSGTEACR